MSDQQDLSAMTKEQVRDAIQKSWAALQAEIRAVPHDRLEEPGVCENWSVKDLLGHISVWDTQVLEDILAFEVGDPQIRVDWQAINDQTAEELATAPLLEQRAAMERAHEVMLYMLDHADRIDPAAVAVDTWQHYDEHAAHIRTWRSGTP